MKRISITHAISKLHAGDSLAQYEWLNEFDFRGSSLGGKHCRFLQCVFHEPIILDDAKQTVKFDLEFDHCTFKKPLNWTELTFNQPITFRTCRFEGYVDCTRSTFHEVTFEDCSFDEKAYFEAVTFWASTSSVDPSRPCVSFTRTIFNDGAEFDQAYFDCSAHFDKTTFYEATTFVKTGFRDCNLKSLVYLDFSHAQIFGSVGFQQSLYFRTDLPSQTPPKENEPIALISVLADFRSVHVHGQHNLRFHTENLRTTRFLGTNLDACYFSNVEWRSVRTHFPLFLSSLKTSSGRKIAWFLLKIVDVLRRGLVTIRRLLSYWSSPHRDRNRNGNSVSTPEKLCRYWRDCVRDPEQYGIYDHFEQVKQQLVFISSCPDKQRWDKEVPEWRCQWALLSRAYRDLKTAYEENKDYIYASDFHYAEKEFRRINYEVPRQTRIQLQLYWLVSGYGERVLRPIWWFLLIWILGAIPYYLWGEPARHPLHETEQSASRTHLSNQ